MTRSQTGALAVTRGVLRALTVLNVVMGCLILALLVASVVAESWTFTALGVQPGQGRSRLIVGGRLIMLLGVLGVPLTHVVLSRILTVVDTVRAGDPFVAANALRLRTIAWTVLGLEAVHLVVGAVAAAASSPAQPFDIGWKLSLSSWLAVLLLFVLARVFEEGTRMREELEGTI